MQKILHKIKENRKIVDCVILLILALILSVPILIKSDTNIYFDDGIHHIMRAYYSHQSKIQNGSANVISHFANGFGYSWNLFYGPLSSALISFFGVIFWNVNIGFKMLLCFILFLAGLAMYKLVNEMTDNQNTALLAGIMYMTSPYFFTDLHVRHAMRGMYGICIFANGIFGIV